MKLLLNAWLWFGLFLIGLYFVTLAGLGALHKWVYESTPALNTAQNASEYATVHVLNGGGIPKCNVEGLEVISGWCHE